MGVGPFLTSNTSSGSLPNFMFGEYAACVSDAMLSGASSMVAKGVPSVAATVAKACREKIVQHHAIK